MSGTSDQRQAELDRDNEQLLRVLNMSDDEIRAGISPELAKKARAAFEEVVADMKCCHCGNLDAPHDTAGGPMCSDCLSTCIDM